MTNSDNQVISQALSILEARMATPGQAINETRDAANFLKLKLGTEEREVFAVLLLDSRHRLIEYRELFFGSVDRAAVYPREVIKAAIIANAAALIMAHNHPSQNPEPSSADIALTDRLTELLGLLDVRVLDHIIVGGTSTVSLADRGLL